MSQYTLSPKQLAKLQTQLHGKHQSTSTPSKTSITSYSIAKDLRKLFIVSTIILIGQFLLLTIL